MARDATRRTKPGFGVVEALAPDALPRVVFVTAFDDYAVRAFDVHAVDYVMKAGTGARAC